MGAASALIGGLGGEKVRWTAQSKEFKAQIERFVLNSVAKTNQCFKGNMFGGNVFRKFRKNGPVDNVTSNSIF